MDSQAASVSYIGKMAEELQAVNKFFACLYAAFDSKAKDGPCTLGEIAFGALIIRMALQAGIHHPGHLGVFLEIFSHCFGILYMTIHAQAQRLNALNGLPGIKRSLAGTNVA